MRIYKSEVAITRTKCTLINSCIFVKSFEYNNRLIMICKLQSKPSLKPRYIAYYNDLNLNAEHDWCDINVICELTAKIIDTITMKNIYTYCYTSKHIKKNLINLIMEKLNEI